MSLRRLGGYVYVMKSSRLFFRCKIGVTKHLKFRINDVDVTTRGRVVYVVYYRFWFPYFVEGLLHWVFSPLRARKMEGASGGTEWFWLPPFWGGFFLFCVWLIGVVLNTAFCISIFIIGLMYVNYGEMERVIEELWRLLGE